MKFVVISFVAHSRFFINSYFCLNSVVYSVGAGSVMVLGASASFDFVNGFVRFISSNLVLKKSMILEGEDFELCFG